MHACMPPPSRPSPACCRAKEKDLGSAHGDVDKLRAAAKALEEKVAKLTNTVDTQVRSPPPPPSRRRRR